MEIGIWCSRDNQHEENRTWKHPHCTLFSRSQTYSINFFNHHQPSLRFVCPGLPSLFHYHSQICQLHVDLEWVL